MPTMISGLAWPARNFRGCWGRVGFGLGWVEMGNPEGAGGEVVPHAVTGVTCVFNNLGPSADDSLDGVVERMELCGVEWEERLVM